MKAILISEQHFNELCFCYEQLLTNMIDRRNGVVIPPPSTPEAERVLDQYINMKRDMLREIRANAPRVNVDYVGGENSVIPWDGTY